MHILDELTQLDPNAPLNPVQSAKLEIEKLKRDAAFMRDYFDGDKLAMTKWRVLHQAAYPEPPKT